MRLYFEEFSAHRKAFHPIRDGDTGEQVGCIQTFGVGFAGSGGIFISLFDAKYTACVNRYDECWGFVHGIETVLNHMLPKSARIQSKAA
jgi:hypothetical protein